MQEIRVQPLGWEESLEKGMAIHYNILAWRIPRREEPGRLHSLWDCKGSNMTEFLHSVIIFAFTFLKVLPQKKSQMMSWCTP